MIDRLICFADPGSGGYGAVALTGEDRGAAVIVRADGGPPVAIDDAAATRGEGTLKLAGDAGELVLGLAARTTPLGFETGPGRTIEVQSVGVSGSMTDPGGSEHGFEANGVSWAIRGEDAAGAVRTLWAFDRRGLFVMFALRDAGATDHAAETVGAVRISGEGRVIAYEEPLLSTEYDAAGHQTRATLELWGGEDGPADRGAGRRSSGAGARLGEAELEAARFEWQLGGEPALGGYEIFNVA